MSYDHHLHFHNPFGHLHHAHVVHHTHGHHGHERNLYVGRIGTLAVTLGIGTAVATGFCAACATAVADPGERDSSSGGSNASTSQSVNPGRRARSVPAAIIQSGLRGAGGGQSGDSSQVPSTGPHGAASSPSAATAAQSPRSSDTAETANPPAEIHVNLPDDTVAQEDSIPAVPDSAPAPESARAAMAQPVADAAVQLPSAALNTPSQIVHPTAVPLLQPSVVVAAPAAAKASSSFSNVLASLADTLNGGTSAATVDASTADATAAAGTRALRPAAAVRPWLAPAATAKETSGTSATTTSSSGNVIEAEKMSRSGSTKVVSDKSASAGSVVAITGKGSVSTSMTIPSSGALTLRLKATSGAPNMTVSVDGVPYTTLMVNSSSYKDYIFAGGLAPGTHTVTISSTTATSKNMLYVDKATLSSGPIVESFTGSAGSAPSSLWTARTGSGFDAGTESYSSSNAVLDGQGHLRLQANRGSNNNYTSGWVWTKNNLTFGYGTVTTRAKVPKGQGLWPSIWMMGADSDTIGWPASGEIDIAELPSTTTTVYSTLHGPITGTSATQQAQIVSNLPDLSTDYHNYWVTHLPDKIIFGVDDQTLGTLTPADLAPGEQWVYNRPMYFIMNLSVGGPWAGAPDASTPSQANMLIDSVTFVPA